MNENNSGLNKTVINWDSTLYRQLLKILDISGF